MTPNLGFTDRALRVVLGAVMLGRGYYFQSWWGLVGLVPLRTALVRVCPADLPLGLKTCGKDGQ